MGGDAPAADVEVQAAEELAVRARADHQRAADLDRLRQPVVSVAAEDDVEAAHARGQLEVDGDPVVAQQHDGIDLAPIPQLVDQRLDLILADAEREIGHEPPRMRHRRVGKRLADDAELDAADLADGARLEHALAPARFGDVLGEELAGEPSPALTIAEQLAHALEPVDELPVRGEHLDAQLVRRPQHVVAPAPQRGGRALQRIAAVEQQRPARPLGPDALDQRGQVRVATEASVARRQSRKIEIRRRVGFRAAPWDAVRPEEPLAGQIGRLPALLTDAEQRVGLAGVHGQERRMRVGEVQQRDVAERRHVEQPLGRLARLGKSARSDVRRPGDGDELHQIASRQVHVSVRPQREERQAGG